MRSTLSPLLWLCATIPAAVVLMDSARSHAKGVLQPSPPSAYARVGPSCGYCHAPFPGGPSVFVVPTLRVLSSGQKISITVTSTGGAPKHPTLGLGGGFVADVSAGTFAAGSTSQVTSSGTWITHTNPFNAQRYWNFGYTAPTTPGRVDLWTVVNTVDGNNQNTNDQWAWHGNSPLNTFSTPVRLYVNAKAVQAVGTGCADGNGNVGVLGAPLTPTVGQAFRLEGFGLPPGQKCLLVFGVQQTFTPVSAASLGAPRCFLNTDFSPLQLPFATTGSNTSQNRAMANGTFTLAAPIPNSSSLKGLFLRAQLLVVDPDSGNPLPVVFTNGLAMTVQ